MDLEYINEIRLNIQDNLDNNIFGNGEIQTRISPFEQSLTKYIYKGYDSKLDIPQLNGHKLLDLPLELIPDYSYLHQEFSNSKSAGATIYEPLDCCSEEDLIKIIKDSSYPDFELLIVAREITGDDGPSYIEIRTAASVFSHPQDDDDFDWSFFNLMNSYLDDLEFSTTINQSYFINYGIISSMELFDDAVKAASLILEMYQEYVENPDHMIMILETYKSSINLPKIILWLILVKIHEAHLFNGLGPQFNGRLALILVLNCMYLVRKMKDVIENYKNAYPRGYFSVAKSARSAE